MRKKTFKSNLLLLPLILFGSFQMLFPGTGNIKFERITIKEGLSQSSVRSILQDRKGFMWFATVDGLNKYDGYSFKVKKPDPNDANSLSSPFLRAIIEDHQGILWIGTNGGGLNKFDPISERFTRFQNNPHDPGSLSYDYVWAVYEDRSKRLWIGTDGGGLNQFDRETETFIRYRHHPNNPNSLSHDNVLCICEDRAGMLWIGTRGGGLNKFDPDTGQFTLYQHDPHDPGSLSSNDIWAICEDRTGTLWIGTNGGGLNKFLREKETFIHYRHNPNNPNSIGHDRIASLYQDRQGTLWIGTNGGGITKCDPSSERFTTFRSDLNKPNSLSDNHIFSIYEDRAGVLWFGTENGGVNKLDRNKEHFIHYQAIPGEPNSLNDNSIWSIYEDRSGVLWIGTREGGINRMDRQTGKVTHYGDDPTDPDYATLSGNYIRAIYEAPSEPGILWIGVDEDGLHRFDPFSGRLTHYRHSANDPNSLSNNRVYTIYEDRAGILWIGTRVGGLNKFDRQKNQFVAYRNDPYNPDTLSNDYVYSLREDHLGIFWVGTFAGGLNKFDRQNETFTSYRTNVKDPNSISSNCILCIYEDRSGELWLGTGGGGLNKFDRETEQFVHYTEKHGLPNAVIYGILEDQQGNLWISTNDGISRFNPGDEGFKNYTEKDGLQSNEFNGGAYFKSPVTGEMFFGGINGFNAFFPGKIKDNTYKPPIVITGFLKFNKEVELPWPISEITELTLSYRDYVFSFEFAALDYTVPEKNKYAYKMEGLNENWIYTDAWKRFASFTTLSPGQYVFRVTGSNSDGIWNEQGAAIRITITPPFWKTWWFRVLAIVTILFISIVLYRKKVKNLSIRTRMETELQTAQEAQMAIMPHQDPEVTGFDISGLCIPASEVGGDFFDYLWMDEKHTYFGIAVGDVSGKAMKAAITAVMSNGIIFSKAFETHSIKDIMTRINKPLYFKTEKQVFTALCLISININTREMTFSNAGLNPPLLKSGESVSKLESSGPRFPLGLRKNIHYREKTFRLNPGDIVILYTDGISESWNVNEEVYGNQRLSGFLKQLNTIHLSAKGIIAKIMEDIEGFSGEITQQDDKTVVAIKVL